MLYIFYIEQKCSLEQKNIRIVGRSSVMDGALSPEILRFNMKH